MTTNDYLKVTEIAKEKKVTTRTFRNKILKLIGLVADDKIIRDFKNGFRIHKLSLSKSNSQRIHKKNIKNNN